MAFNFHQAEKGIVLANSHRGYSSCRPENTFPAFEAARLAGTHCIEIDIHLTADNQLVVTHDHRVDRVSTGQGFVEQLTYPQLLEFDFGMKYHPDFAGTRIPLLADVLRWAVKNGMGLIVEAKQRRRHDEFVAAMVAMLRELPEAISHIQMLGFNHALINRVKAHIPELALQVVTLERYNNQLVVVQQSNASCVCFEYEFAHIDDLRAYKKAGLGVRMYLHEVKNGLDPLTQYQYKFGYDSRPEILSWLREGLIDMLSHDDIPYLQALIEEAGLRWD
ncbi:glycerophosphoryl diester phosphodiesterase family protein [Yersinia pseudotuberculosis IP 32953]|uniref:GP-PDE domain-containing protein n=2 Tax=Yersinia pseudotuberculosis TaxID=633 RepID=Q66AW3_YERPS|nr:glycerophosphodiester phosphodiesterase [Yersinia pseudotuberculosis]AJJ57133.1 glycerophosphoryl diester phosphodiesterase family protein [Yersinia pseudotuberculosis IP 32953]AYW93266.1 glycerophosphodiester phosphodiesterase [Yersinia pseudotuberculosis]AYW97428.1 glycerophosphodiester phosphodiesterase [Yersinia pseudotuberculosis]KGA65612.1 glycerophosphoryl diester phosphodiesterase family protein [Yersinia pseudotuberculosis]MBO1630802.1 glycerophosphodiester phosphodiesterase [Yersi